MSHSAKVRVVNRRRILEPVPQRAVEPDVHSPHKGERQPARACKRERTDVAMRHVVDDCADSRVPSSAAPRADPNKSSPRDRVVKVAGPRSSRTGRRTWATS
jgi:hypothetical protein